MRIWVDDERDPREWLPHIRWFRGRGLKELDEGGVGEERPGRHRAPGVRIRC
jgi:hypothetical protein